MNSKKIFLSLIILSLLLIILIPISTKAFQIVPNCSTTATDSSGAATGVNNVCTICDFFRMLVNIYNFIVQIIATPLAILAIVIGDIPVVFPEEIQH